MAQSDTFKVGDRVIVGTGWPQVDSQLFGQLKGVVINVHATSVLVRFDDFKHYLSEVDGHRFNFAKVQHCRDSVIDGVKHDSGKPRLSMIFSPKLRPAIVELVRVLEYGAAKYPEEDNWARVENAKKRYTDAGLRHAAACSAGELRDDESKLLHAAHAACNFLFVAALELIK